MANEKCIFCLEVKTDPVGLPCGHTFCLICLENYERIGNGTKCPLCRHPFVSNVVQDSAFAPLNLTDEENNNNGNIQIISGYLEEDNQIDYSDIEDDYEQEMNFIDDLIETDFQLFSASEQENEGNFENSHGLSHSQSEVDSMNLTEEQEQVEFVIDTDVEEEPENFSLYANQIEFDGMDESPIEFYEETEYETELLDSESDNEP